MTSPRDVEFLEALLRACVMVWRCRFSAAEDGPPISSGRHLRLGKVEDSSDQDRRRDAGERFQETAGRSFNRDAADVMLLEKFDQLFRVIWRRRLRWLLLWNKEKSQPRRGAR